jgi:hypothetical protein
MHRPRTLLAAALGAVLLVVACNDTAQDPIEQLNASIQDLAVDPPGTKANPQSKLGSIGTILSEAVAASTVSSGASCAVGVISGTLDAAVDPTQSGRTWRDGNPSTCAGKPYPGLLSGTYYYKVFGPYGNGAPNTCATVTWDAGTCGVYAHAAAYANSYDPTDQELNYIGDLGSSISQPFSFPIPPYQDYVIVAHSNFGGFSSCDFSFEVSNVPCGAVIDIKPGSDPNSINLKSQGVIPVAVMTTSVADGDLWDFDATTVDRSTVAFGPGGATPAHDPDNEKMPALHLQDVDGDGDTDLVLHFENQAAGLQAGDVQACLTGATLGGDPFIACDAVRVIEQGPKGGGGLKGQLESLTFYANHANCSGGASFAFELNGVALGTAAVTSPCACNSDELTVTFDSPEAQEAWNKNGGNTLRVEVTGDINNVGVGYIRADIAVKKGATTVAVFDATGGDASTRDLCDGFVWGYEQSIFELTLE